MNELFKKDVLQEVVGAVGGIGLTFDYAPLEKIELSEASVLEALNLFHPRPFRPATLIVHPSKVAWVLRWQRAVRREAERRRLNAAGRALARRIYQHARHRG